MNKKRKQRGSEEKSFNITHVQKKSTFLISIILTIAFSNINIWLTYILSSLCKKPKLLNSLYSIFHTANIISHTQSHEKKLEKNRMKKVNLKERLF